MKLAILSSSTVAVLLLAACATRTAPPPEADAALTPGIFLDSDEVGSRALLPAGATLRPVYDHGLAVTKVSEGFRPRLYEDVAGYCSIAYGHLVKKKRCDGSESAEFLAGVSEPRATVLLTGDMARAQAVVMTTVVNVELNDAQYAALCDFVYNVGGANFQSSRLLRVINLGQMDQVPTQMRRWIMADNKVVDGLKNRREREIALFFEGQPTPKAVPPAGEDLSPIDIRTGR
jgi:GH24 family phage-related lysozyme (muramidase)